MKWAKTIRYQTSVSVDDEIFNIMLESDIDNAFAVYVNSEYTCDVEAIPDREKLEQIISEVVEIDEHLNVRFPGER